MLIMGKITPHGPSGRPLDPNWKLQAETNRREFDAILRERLENAWKGPLRGSSNHITARSARLTGNHDRADSISTVRMDGKMVMVGRQDEWEIWRDSVSGATVWKRTK